ncbi:MAG: DUF2179 domain-containing protein [Candidatus Aminicenantes bacterium]|nr:DUF2179 domain-containing protein [Candidatus Aminicenantes bacterium]
MDFNNIFQPWVLNWLIIPLFIFLARLMDVTLGTMRIVFVSRGLKYMAPLVGFFEVLIWLLAIRQILQNLNNVACYLAYAGGFALGNIIGIHIEKKMALGRLLIRIITRKEALDLVPYLRAQGYGVTCLEAEGATGKVNVIYMIIRRQDQERISCIIKRFNPKAFFTIEDVRIVSEGVFPFRSPRFAVGVGKRGRNLRKGK